MQCRSSPDRRRATGNVSQEVHRFRDECRRREPSLRRRTLSCVRNGRTTASGEDPTVRESSNPVFRSLPKAAGWIRAVRYRSRRLRCPGGTGRPVRGSAVPGSAAGGRFPAADHRRRRHQDRHHAGRADRGRPSLSYFLVSPESRAGHAVHCSSARSAASALVLIATFGRKQDNPAIVLSYAALEGLFLGAFSFVFANLVVSGVSAGALIAQAIVGTFGVFFGMLVVYKTGAIRVTPKFTRMMVAAPVRRDGRLMLVNLVLGNVRCRRRRGPRPAQRRPARDHLLAGLHRSGGVHAS